MSNYLVTYTYQTLGANFAEHWKHTYVTASSKQDAINKVRKQAPRNARYFKAYRQ